MTTLQVYKSFHYIGGFSDVYIEEITEFYVKLYINDFQPEMEGLYRCEAGPLSKTVTLLSICKFCCLVVRKILKATIYSLQNTIGYKQVPYYPY